jgi:hypothetical protein
MRSLCCPHAVWFADPTPFVTQVMHLIATYTIYVAYQACILDCEAIAKNGALSAYVEAELNTIASWLPTMPLAAVTTM